MNRWTQKVFNKNNFLADDGFNILVGFHRIFGILYIGFDSKQTYFKQVLLIIYGLFIWSIVFIFNTPCLLVCFLKKEQIGSVYSFYFFNFVLTSVNVVNIFTAIIFSIRGLRFQKLIEKLRKFSINNKSLIHLKIFVYLNVTILITIIIVKSILFGIRFDYFYVFKIIEDSASEVLADQTQFLLIYFSLYVTSIILEFNTKLKDSFSSINCVYNFKELRNTIVNTQKIINKINRILSPCLLLTFSLRTVGIIFFCSSLYKSFADDSHLPVNFYLSILIMKVTRLLVCCVFVDRMNQKVSYIKEYN
jgi:hypothetical protein